MKQAYTNRKWMIEQIKILVLTNCGYYRIRSKCAELVRMM